MRTTCLYPNQRFLLLIVKVLPFGYLKKQAAISNLFLVQLYACRLFLTYSFIQNTDKTKPICNGWLDQIVEIIMSDATKIAYSQTGSLASAVQAGISRHVELSAAHGGEYNLALLQSSKGTESTLTPRSMFSVSISYNVANYYAGSTGHVYSGSIDRRLLLPSPLNRRGGGESEYFIRVAYPMMRIK